MAEGKLYIEKRKHKRVTKELDVKYKIVPGGINSAPANKTNGKSRDLSIGGACIDGEVVGKPNDVLRVEIDMGNHNSLVFFAQMKWIKGTQFGVEFLTLREHDQELLEELID